MLTSSFLTLSTCVRYNKIRGKPTKRVMQKFTLKSCLLDLLLA